MILSRLAVLLLGSSMIFSYSPFDQAWLPFIVLAALLFVLRNRSAKEAWSHGFYFGVGWFGAGLSWIYVSIDQFGGLHPALSIFVLLILFCYLAIYPALALWLWKRSEIKYGRAAIWLLPLFWLISESIRGWFLTGFPWLELGYTQTDSWFGNYAPWVGGAGVTLFMWAVVISAVRWFDDRHWSRATLCALLLALPLLLPWYKTLERTGEEARVLLVQGNISQSLKWNPDQHWPSLMTYLNLSRPHYATHDIVIWPESAVTMPEVYTDDVLANIHDELVYSDTSLITGIIDYRDREYYNSMIVLGMDSPHHVAESYFHGHSNRYQKHHLLPIGEFVPFEDLLRPLAPLFNLPMSSFQRGELLQQDLRGKGFNLNAAICYEIAFPGEVRANLQSTTDFIVTVSNDSWFGASHGPAQHMQIARMRALELGRPLLRATNSGITAIVNEYGQEMARAPQFTATTLSANVAVVRGTTLYQHWGSITTWLTALLIALCGVFGIVKRRQNQ